MMTNLLIQLILSVLVGVVGLAIWATVGSYLTKGIMNER